MNTPSAYKTVSEEGRVRAYSVEAFNMDEAGTGFWIRLYRKNGQVEYEWREPFLTFDEACEEAERAAATQK